MSTKEVDGVTVALTQAEIDERAAEEAAWAAGEYDRAMEGLRKKRDRLLAETDYLALADQPTMSQAMIDYRQALRDATNGLLTVADVNAYVFPTKP